MIPFHRVLTLVVVAILSGNSATDLLRAAGQPPTPSPVILREGDELRITFPGAPTLDTVQRIRTDGRLSLPLVGEVQAAGFAPSVLQEQLVALYAPQLVAKEINLVLLSRSFFVYVNGAVTRAGRNDFDRPVDLLEAIMAAGFNDETANLKAVQVIRIEHGEYVVHEANLQQIFDGKKRDPFTLRQGDMILVRRRWL